MNRHAVTIFAAGTFLAINALPALADAYVNQLDGGAAGFSQSNSGSGPAYIEQMPADARPVPAPPVRKTNSSARQAGKSRTREISSRNQPAFPNVGAGVSLALAGTKADGQLPNVGRGVVKR